MSLNGFSKLRVFLALTFLSGFSSLIYQVYWIKKFKLIFGATSPSTAVVLAVFMGGLGLGSLWLGKKADGCDKPIAFYAKVEALIAVTALLSLAGLSLVDGYYPVLLGGVQSSLAKLVIRLAMAMLVLLAPTVLMGATLPVVGRIVEADGDKSRAMWSLVYGVNTLGAILGVALPTFVLFEVLGERSTLLFAVAVNAAVAAAAYYMSTSEPRIEIAPQAAQIRRETPWFLGVMAFLSGFLFFLAEIAWYRLLSPILGGSTYTFGCILIGVLAGIGLGGNAYAWIYRNQKARISHIALTGALLALALAFPLFLGDRLAYLATLAFEYGYQGFGFKVFGWLVIAGMVVFPASFMAGIQYPLLVGLTGEGKENIAEDVGFITVTNTAGAVLGLLGGNFIIITSFGAVDTWRLCAFLALLMCVSTLLYSKKSSIPSVLFSILALALALSPGPTAVWRHSGVGIGNSKLTSQSQLEKNKWIREQKRELVYERDGVEAGLAVSNGNGLAFAINGKVDGNAVMDAPTQVMLGLFGALFHPQTPRNALVIGLGTGSTAGWLAKVDSMEYVDVAEIEPAIADYAKMCDTVNKGAMSNPKVRVHAADGREFVSVAKSGYDLIVSEPSNPYRIGIASLFTRDFYLRAKSRLNKGGQFVQWLQAYNVDENTLLTVLSTMRSVYPNVEVWWSMPPFDLMILASDAPPNRNVRTLRTRISSPPFKEALAKTWYVNDLEGVLGRLVAGPGLADALSLSGNFRPDTDDLNKNEYGFARSMGDNSENAIKNLIATANLQGFNRLDFEGDVDWSRVSMGRMTTMMVEGAEKYLYPNGDMELLKRQKMIKGYFGGFDTKQVLDYWEAKSILPAWDSELIILAESLADQGNGKCVDFAEQIRRQHPADADFILALYNMRIEDADSAVEKLCSGFVALRSEPLSTPVIFGRACKMARVLAMTDPQRAEALFGALSEPFGAYAFNNQRLKTRAFTAPTAQKAAQALKELEPDFPWDKELLALREKAYKAAGHPLAELATKELELYTLQEEGE